MPLEKSETLPWSARNPCKTHAVGAEKSSLIRSFAALYGIPETRDLIGKALGGALTAEHEAFLRERSG